MTRRFLITGGSQGIGAALVARARGAGHDVVFTGRDASRVDAVAERTGATGIAADVADTSDNARTVAACHERMGGIDVLVNNAGVTQILPIAFIEEADWDAVMDINVKGAYLCSRAALKPMIRARSGHILNIGSFGSERVIDAPVHYAAAKSALRGFTEALAREVGRYGIKVNLLAPGLLDAGFSRALPQHRIDEYLGQSGLARLGTVAEMARLAAFLVSPDNSFMTGAKVVADGGV
jgi:3-oxoacyl-[acyl-carrier protein] reductase